MIVNSNFLANTASKYPPASVLHIQFIANLTRVALAKTKSTATVTTPTGHRAHQYDTTRFKVNFIPKNGNHPFPRHIILALNYGYYSIKKGSLEVTNKSRFLILKFRKCATCGRLPLTWLKQQDKYSMSSPVSGPGKGLGELTVWMDGTAVFAVNRLLCIILPAHYVISLESHAGPT